jgi:hypothetical protein
MPNLAARAAITNIPQDIIAQGITEAAGERGADLLLQKEHSEILCDLSRFDGPAVTTARMARLWNVDEAVAAKHIQHIVGVQAPTAEDEAKARMAATAPEMLEALRLAYNIMSCVVIDNEYKAQAFRNVHNAILRAEGRA